MVKNNSKNKGGRPADSKSEAYMRAFMDIIDVVTWKDVVRKAREDALDPEDPITRDRARRWLKEVIIGRPASAPSLPSDEVDTDMSDKSLEELQKMVEDGEKDIKKLYDNTSNAVEKFLDDADAQ